ncbi:hypothetical protein [Pelobacter propionicus]|uniref:Uncharacterized protein n=1 Tax=Pelobacter propionicus (strain DSM 2379 / NBRC 103807 / OttBd1) TaxID=338966 RepID=A0R7T7_PELPD|nr:hypothetical protein [Pelobacter propionicus]ABL01402.1 hypothetical protein Ppro_3814 [Pelobacter propionicus DSM 2379]
MNILPRNTWRYVTQPYKDRKGNNCIHKELVSPGDYTRIDKNIEERLAVPTPVKGPFTMHNNGYGTLQISDGNNRMVTAVSFYQDGRDPSQQVEAEEALWLGNVIVEALNKAAEAAASDESE